MAYEKAQRLIEQLHKKTIEGDLDWEEGPDTESFQVNFSDYSITIESLSDLNATEEYQIVIRNSTGRVLERFSDLDIPRIGGGQQSSKVFGEIFDQARRYALGTDKALDDILGALSH